MFFFQCRFGSDNAIVDADWTHCTGINVTDLLFEKEKTSNVTAAAYNTSRNEFGRNGGKLVEKVTSCISSPFEFNSSIGTYLSELRLSSSCEGRRRLPSSLTHRRFLRSAICELQLLHPAAGFVD